MDEHVLAAVIRLDEPKPFGFVEPLDLACHGDRRCRIGGHASRRPGVPIAISAATTTAGGTATEARPFRLSRRKIGLDDAGYLLALLARGNRNFQLCAGRKRLVTSSLNGANVKERIACTVSEFDEAETPCRP